MKKWNNPEIAELNISETAKSDKCHASNGTCSSYPGNWGYCNQITCPYYDKFYTPTPTPTPTPSPETGVLGTPDTESHS